ncbi:MAG: hypothetical protein ACKVXR_08820 [Planctomycetota bacterium]
MQASDLAVRHSRNQSPNALFRIGRTSLLALALIWVGSTAYAAFAWQDGEVEHSMSTEKPHARWTRVGFDAWQGIVPSPLWPEYHYEEVRLSNGDWIKHGRYGRLTRQGTAREEGSYYYGQREGPWTFWDSHGGFDVERSGFYSNDERIKPGPASPDDLAWNAARLDE